jgi:predicted RecB family nuclease
MYFDDHGQIVYSPSDLTRFMESPFAAWMDRLYLEQPDRVTPDEANDELQIYADAGISHEASFVTSLEGEGKDLCWIKGSSRHEKARATRQAIMDGREIIFQAYLTLKPFAGYADFLARVSADPLRYEVWDTKLAKTPKPYYLIQLCCYAEMLESIQGQWPEFVEVILGNGTRQRFRTEDYWYYYQQLKTAFLEQMAAFDADGDHPVPDPRADHGRWQSHAENWLLQRDHLFQVANISVSQIKKLNDAGIETLAQLAKSRKTRIPRLSDDSYRRLVAQAAVQMQTRRIQSKTQDANSARPAYEVLPQESLNPRSGLALLPPASNGDVYFDIEGYPLLEGGLEYLLGVVTVENDRPQFHDWWAHDSVEEKRSFEQFIDWVMARWKKDPAMHIYHYAAYEVSAMRRLMGRHGTREDEVDALLRAEVFVDLYQVIRQSILLGASNYSLKTVETLYQDQREGEVKSAGASMVYYARWITSDESHDWKKSAILKDIRDYNEVDCVSTWQATEWLRQLQERCKVSYCPPLPKASTDGDGAATVSKGTEAAQRRRLLADQLIRQIPERKSVRAKHADKWKIQELLSQLVEFHRREDKPVWWAMFDRAAMTEAELVEDLNCLGGLQRTNDPPETIKRSLGFWYEFDPVQDTKLRSGSTVFASHDLKLKLTIETFDDDGRVLLKISNAALNKLPSGNLPDRMSLIPDEDVSAAAIEDAIERLTGGWLENQRIPAAFRQFLLRQPPRLKDQPAGLPLAQPRENTVEACVRIAGDMLDSTLCIQGPPGTGKTYTASQMIVSLLKDGKSIGVTSNSHNAILNVMSACVEAMSGELTAIKAGGDAEDPIFEEHPGIQYVASGSDAAAAFNGGLIGGTAWLFARPEMASRLDYLFVDEAGQVSIANLAGMCHATKNIVLIGDQMQLSQPIQGSHPGESGRSLLEYLLQDHAVVPPGLGVFLGQTRRMHPDICSFISGCVYEGRLHSHPETEKRIVKPPARVDHKAIIAAGIVFVEVPHTGNVQGSDEEADRIVQITADLLKCEHTDQDGQSLGKLQLGDILYVAPYNLQVRKLRERLPVGARIGSVDKFQGQEAPVVIISMCSSANDFGTRGLQFLLNRNRLNVAVSRAKSLTIVIGDPGIAHTSVNSVKDMELVNMFCRLKKYGESVAVST